MERIIAKQIYGWVRDQSKVSRCLKKVVTLRFAPKLNYIFTQKSHSHHNNFCSFSFFVLLIITKHYLFVRLILRDTIVGRSVSFYNCPCIITGRWRRRRRRRRWCCLLCIDTASGPLIILDCEWCQRPHINTTISMTKEFILLYYIPITPPLPPIWIIICRGHNTLPLLATFIRVLVWTFLF